MAGQEKQDGILNEELEEVSPDGSASPSLPSFFFCPPRQSFLKKENIFALGQ